MKVVILTHPRFFPSQSIPRFVDTIRSGFQSRGIEVEIWSAGAWLSHLCTGPKLNKALQYFDQLLIFPVILLIRLLSTHRGAVFIVADHALGPIIPLIAWRPHVIHVHDFIALRSVMGEFPPHRPRILGRIYQQLIAWGFKKGTNFVCVSEKSRQDLLRFLGDRNIHSEVVYNGLNYPFSPLNETARAETLGDLYREFPRNGYLVHVGGNQWYKNRKGVVEIYREYCQLVADPLPLRMIGIAPNAEIVHCGESVPKNGNVKFYSGFSNEQVRAAYAGASLTLFPSIAEGFGWPIAEAMACGSLVLTTGEPPMTEVGGHAAYYIPRRPWDDTEEWARNSAGQMLELLQQLPTQASAAREQGILQAGKFKTDVALQQYFAIYSRCLGLTCAGGAE